MKHIIDDKELEKHVLDKFKERNIVEIKLLSSVRGKSEHGDRYFLLKNNKDKYALAVSNGWPTCAKGTNEFNEGTIYFNGFIIESEILTDFEYDEIIAESWQDEIFYLRKGAKWFLVRYNGFKKGFFSEACDRIEKTYMGETVYKLYNSGYYDILDLGFQYLYKSCPTFDDKSKENAYLNKKIYKEKPFCVRDMEIIIPYLVKLVDGIDVVLEEHVTSIKEVCNQFAILCLAIKSDDDNLVQQEIESRMSAFDSPYWISSMQRKLLEKQVLLTPANHYIQLSYYRKYGERPRNSSIYFRHNYGVYNFPFDYDECESKICDERFFYIIDFMNLLVEKRFEKEDFCLKLAEMQKLAEEFAENYRNEKNIVRQRAISDTMET